MSEISIDYTQNPTGSCEGLCFTTQMYLDVLNSKINNGKNLEIAYIETMKELLNCFNPHTFSNTITNHITQCYFDSKENINEGRQILFNL